VANVIHHQEDVLDARPPTGRQIAKARIAAGLSQRVLAERVGCALISIQSIEQGRLKPGAPLMGRIRDALGWDEADE
jgi:ribosome-binding protein aMBF1 (putative translation factor)